MNWIIKTITNLMSRKFYGQLTIIFENGKITRAKKEESLKPE
jgi:hypothetical protein